MTYDPQNGAVVPYYHNNNNPYSRFSRYGWVPLKNIILGQKFLASVMLVTMLKWWLYVADTFKMLVAESLC